jgi:hypothetical protein
MSERQCKCGKSIPDTSSSANCDYCDAFWTLAYEEGRRFEREYGDEVNRLRAQLDDGPVITDMIRDLKSDNERLRAALKILYEDRAGRATRSDAFDVARAALKAEGKP